MLFRSNILVIGATNRAADLDPALLRPGRFDRSISFDLPSRSGRREIIDYYLDRKAHVPELDREDRRDQLAEQPARGDLWGGEEGDDHRQKDRGAGRAEERLLPLAAHAQSAFIGTVKDASGGVLPGVTVEAASPVLIEKTRSAVSDGSGQFRIADLRPGTYSVTFTLTGFSTVKRDGIVLTAAFTAPVNADMKVGSLEETITVSGAAPVVDTTSMRKQETLNTSELEALPSGNIGLQTLAYVTPGFAATQADVGGTRDTWSAQGNYTLFHGKAGTRANFDGFRNQYFVNEASGVGYITDSGNIQELQIETSGMGAEAGSGSVSLNAIPKSGSNSSRLANRCDVLQRPSNRSR